MARKRHRTRPKAKVAVDASTAHTEVDVANEKRADVETTAVDSGNESPQADVSEQWKDQLISYHRSESIKAWKCYQACVLERQHWYLDRKRRAVAEEFAHKIADAYLGISSGNMATFMDDLQTSLTEELKEIDTEESVANRIFQENIKSLEAGKSMGDLPLIDSHVTEDQVSEFITKYMNFTLERVGDVPKEMMSLSFSSSTTSQDSGLLSPGKSGIFTSLSDDIWKPDDGEILNDSFTANSFYQPDVETKLETTTKVHEEAKPYESQPIYQPSIDEEDSAIKAVVYCKPPVLEEQKINDATIGGWGNKLLGYSALAELSGEYSSGGNPLCSPPAHVEVPPCSDANYMPDELTCDTGKKVIVDANELSSGVLDLLVIPDKPKANSNKEPVKFVDCRTVDRKDMQLAKGISFQWSTEEEHVKGSILSNQVETKLDGKCVAPGLGVADSMPTSKPLSFAAVASAAPPANKPVISNKSKPVETNSKVVFSTKQPTRKFDKSSSLNKTGLCWTFLKMKSCPWGNNCIFAHGKKELRPLPKWFKKDDTSSSKLNQKLCESPHTEPCGNHFCHWRRQFLLRKTELCKLWLGQRCPISSENCRFAHGEHELKPLPKHEMCRMFQTGKCYLKSSECVYAHDKKELRSKAKKPKKVTLCSDSGDPTVLSSSPVSRLRTISETSTGSNDSWSAVVGRERVRTISGTSVHSNTSQGLRDLEEFDWHAWNAESEVPADEELDYTWNEDECVICSHEFSADDPQVPLECNHDNFHRKCITQWVEKDQTCPICRTHTEMSGADLCGAEMWHLE